MGARTAALLLPHLILGLGARTGALGETLVLQDATVHTVSGGTIAGGSVTIAGGRITQVARDSSAPAGARVVDLRGKHVYPGLINASTLLGIYEIRDVRSTRDDSEIGDWNPHVRVEVALNPSSRLLPVARASGVLGFVTYPTSGRIPGTAALAYTDGWTSEELLVRAPIGLVINWPAMRLDWTGKKPIKEQARERLSSVTALDEFFANARVYSRSMAAGNPTMAQDSKWSAMTDVVAGDVPVIIRAGDLPAIDAALDWAAAQDLRVILIVDQDAGRAADLLAARRVPVILTGTQLGLPRTSEPYDSRQTAAARLHAAGVTFTFGTGMNPYGTYNARQLAHIAGIASGFGLPPEAAVRAMTLSAAEICGVSDRLGSIEVGKDATLIVTDGDILDIRTHVESAWIEGRPVDLTNKHTDLYERYRNRPPRRSQD